MRDILNGYLIVTFEMDRKFYTEIVTTIGVSECVRVAEYSNAQAAEIGHNTIKETIEFVTGG